MRFFIKIAYNGSNYHGWQIQTNASSVQGELNKALSTLLREKILVYGAGRTDTGVHAKEMYAHFDIDHSFDSEKLIYKLNKFLPEDISCFSIYEVKADAHVRFDATARTYEYWVSQHKNPFLTGSAFYFPFPLDIENMNNAATILLNHTDFSCFSKSNTDTFTNNCDITYAKWEIQGDKLVFTITANRFLRNMVRAIVGTLLDVGQGRVAIEDIQTILDSKSRGEAGQSVPAHGLYLTKVSY